MFPASEVRAPLGIRITISGMCSKESGIERRRMFIAASRVGAQIMARNSKPSHYQKRSVDSAGIDGQWDVGYRPHERYPNNQASVDGLARFHCRYEFPGLDGISGNLR